jgi:hypothetical protein
MVSREGDLTTTYMHKNIYIYIQGSLAVMVSREGDLTMVQCTLGGPAERNYDMKHDTVCVCVCVCVCVFL